jgi:hypothetical protein
MREVSMDNDIQQVRSHSIDFETDEWVVRPIGPDYRVGSGIYLMVPIHPMHAQKVKQAIQGILNGLPPVDPSPLV